MAYTISDDVILEIMRSCSPYDLVNMQAVCKRFISILDHNRFCWSESYFRIHEAPAPPKIHSKGYWSEAAYSTFLLGGGLCDYCHRWTHGLPFSVSLRLRSCNPHCREQVFQTDVITKFPPPELVTLPHQLLRLVPVDRRDMTETLYCRSSDLKIFLAEYTPTALPSMSDEATESLERAKWRREQGKINFSLTIADQELSVWCLDYIPEKEAFTQMNASFLRKVALAENLTYGNLIRTPTAARIFHAFNRDLSKMNMNVWLNMRKEVLHEARIRRGNNIGPTLDYPCPVCKQVFPQVRRLQDHVASKHRYANVPPVFDIKRTCQLCPPSNMKKYSVPGLAHHKRDVHPTQTV